MTTTHVQYFAEIVAKDPELSAIFVLDKVTDDASAASLAANAVIEAKRVGLAFTEEEARAWMKAEADYRTKGELSDTQLEAVAGGKGGAKKGDTYSNTITTTTTTTQLPGGGTETTQTTTETTTQPHGKPYGSRGT